MFGRWTAVAASYNRGISGLMRAFKNQQVNSYYDLNLNEETSKYIFRILALKDLISQPDKYGIKVRNFAKPRTKTVKIDSTIYDLSAFARNFYIDDSVLHQY